MIIRCSWHNDYKGQITGTKPPYGRVYDHMVIDGICEECLEKYFPKPKHEPSFVRSIVVSSQEDDGFE